MRKTYFYLDGDSPQAPDSDQFGHVVRALNAYGEHATGLAMQFFMALKDIIQQMNTLLNRPGAVLLGTYKKCALSSMIQNQAFWSDTQSPETDLYPVHGDDNVRAKIIQLTLELPRINDVDLRLSQKLSSNWDSEEKRRQLLVRHLI